MKAEAKTYIPTQAAGQAAAFLDEIRLTDQAALLSGTTGSGKTTLVQRYTLDANAAADVGERPVVLHVADVVSTPRALVSGLLAAVDINWHGTALSGLSVLRARMRKADVRLVIVDEAHRLAANALETLRALRETTGVALVLVGPPRLRGQLMARAPELAHQIVHVAATHEVQAHELVRLVGSGPHRERRYRQRVAMARTLARATHGNFRRALQLLQASAREARRRHRALSAGHPAGRRGVSRTGVTAWDLRSRPEWLPVYNQTGLKT